MTLPTASGLPRADLCPTSCALPQSKTVGDQWSNAGQVVHRFLEIVPTLGRDEALLQVHSDLRPVCELLELDKLPTDPKAFAAEVAFAWDFRTGAAHELGRGLERNYAGVSPTEIAGTADVVALTADGGVYVGDYKYGFSHTLHTPHPKRNLQLRFLALAAARAYHRDHAIVEIIRLQADGVSWKERAELDAFDLADTAERVRELVVRIDRAAATMAAGAWPEVVAGPHCRYCPAYTWCPEQTRLLQQLAQAPGVAMTEVSAQLTAEGAARAYRAYRTIKALIDHVGEQLHSYSTVHPIDLGDGLVYGPLETRREQVDGAVARTVLAEIHGQVVADAACEWNSSKRAIEDALRPVAQKTGEKITRLKKAALAAIDERGGLSVKVSANCKEHRPRLELAAPAPTEAS